MSKYSIWPIKIQCPWCKQVYEIQGIIADNYICNCDKEFSI